MMVDLVSTPGPYGFGMQSVQTRHDADGPVVGKPRCSVNVAADSEVKSWANRLLNIYGPPDLLVNNAAIINRNATLWKVGAQEFSDVIDVNIKGVANVIRHFIPPWWIKGAA